MNSNPCHHILLKNTRGRLNTFRYLLSCQNRFVSFWECDSTAHVKSVKTSVTSKLNDLINNQKPAVAESRNVDAGCFKMEVLWNNTSLHCNQHLGNWTEARSRLRMSHVGLNWSYQQRRRTVMAENVCYRVHFLGISSLTTGANYKSSKRVHTKNQATLKANEEIFKYSFRDLKQIM